MATTHFNPRRAAAMPQSRNIVAALLARVAGWRYVGERRDLRFDLLRGLAVIAMVTDHVGGDKSWLYALTGGNHFWTSAAEGFVFISGLVMGIVYPAVVARQGLGAALLKVLKRAGTLYALTVLLTLTTAALAYRLQVHWAPQVTAGTLAEFVIGVLTLHRAYYLTDVLLMYTLLVFAAAGAIFLINEKRTRLVLAISWATWGIWQFFPQQAALPWAITDNSVFNLAAWQLLFFNGLVIGYHRKALAERFGWATGRIALLVSGTLFAGSVALYRDGLAPLIKLTGRDAAWFETYIFSKSDERIGRVLAFAIFASFALSLVTNLWQPILKAFGWLLLPLGQSALLAYGLHLFVIMFTTKIGPTLLGEGDFTASQNALLQSLGILIIWTIVVVRPRALQLLQGLRPTWSVTPRVQHQRVAVRVPQRRS
ncbi:MAG TPA: OpgC domain-containing protein [Thermomicrobiales bacterium]